MKLNIAIVFGCLLAFVCVGSSQTKTVTNADLERFKEKRIRAEKDLRENYAKLGFPSPEELEKQNAQSEKERIELFVKLQAARIERERADAEIQRAANENANRNQPIVVVNGTDRGFVPIYGYSTYWNPRFRSFRQPNNGVRWRVAGGQVIYEPGGSSFVTGPPLGPTGTTILRGPRRR